MSNEERAFCRKIVLLRSKGTLYIVVGIASRISNQQLHLCFIKVKMQNMQSLKQVLKSYSEDIPLQGRIQLS